MNVTFDPRDYYFEYGMPVDGTFWIELNGKEEVPVSTKKRFYTPSHKAKKEWNEMLKFIYQIEEHVFYDPAITGLINNIPFKMKVEVQKNHDYLMNAHKELFSFPEKTLDDDRILELLKIELQAEMSANDLMIMLGKEDSVPKRKELSDFEKRLMVWKPGYGFLVDRMTSFPFSRPKDSDSLKYEIVREYLFHLREYPEVVLSLAQEPNSDRAIWGLRRTMNLDWPFDESQNTFKRVLEKHEISVDIYIDQMNNLIENLENIVTR